MDRGDWCELREILIKLVVTAASSVIVWVTLPLFDGGTSLALAVLPLIVSYLQSLLDYTDGSCAPEWAVGEWLTALHSRVVAAVTFSLVASFATVAIALQNPVLTGWPLLKLLLFACCSLGGILDCRFKTILASMIWGRLHPTRFMPPGYADHITPMLRRVRGYAREKKS